MNVLMLLDGSYEGDLRVRKETDALSDTAHKLSVVCYRLEGESLEEVVEGVKVYRTRKVMDRSRTGWMDIWNSITYMHPDIWNRCTELDESYDLIHVHDLPLAHTGLKCAKRWNSTTILDLHENFPAAIATWFVWRRSKIIRLKNWLFFNSKIWVQRERRMVKKFDHIIAVVDEMKERLVSEHGISEAKVTVVRNSEPSDLFESLNLRTDIKRGEDLVYVGGIGPHRGLDTAVLGVKRLVELGYPRKLRIIGSGAPDNVKYLKTIAKTEKIQDWVVFTGHLPRKEAISQMQGAFLNIIPHHSNPQNDNGTPHKLFQILNSGYPLLVSSSKPLKRTVETHNAGLVFEAGNPESFAKVVLEAEQMPDELERMARNGREATLSGGLNWETDSKRLVSLYSSL